MNTLKSRLIVFCVLAVCSTPAVVFADTYTITDYSTGPDGSNSYWGGGVTLFPTGEPIPNISDTLGGNNYDVDTLTVTRDSNSFSAVLTGQYFQSNEKEFIGDLFLSSAWTPTSSGSNDTHYADNVAGSTTWEYVLRIMNDDPVTPGTSDTGTIGLYKIDSTTGQIVLSNETLVDQQGVYRADQEVQYTTTDPALKTGTWTLDAVTGTFTFSLSLAGLDDDELAFLEGSLGLHWTMSCGNDVIEGQIPAMGASSVPEPATMLLFGAGLSGLAAYRRRARK